MKLEVRSNDVQVTVYTVLSDFGITNNDTVGVVGIGGLGHLAIQFASKMGCDVVAFSSGESEKMR